MSLQKATDIVLRTFRGAEIASFFGDQSRLLRGSGVWAGAGRERRSSVDRDGRKKMGGKDIMNKDPEVRRHEESRARQGLPLGRV